MTNDCIHWNTILKHCRLTGKRCKRRLTLCDDYERVATKYNRDIPLDEWNEYGVTSLCAAICLRAVRDYRLAYNGHVINYETPKFTMDNCDDFFHSPIFRNFVNIKASEVCKLIEEMPEETFKKIIAREDAPEDTKFLD